MSFQNKIKNCGPHRKNSVFGYIRKIEANVPLIPTMVKCIILLFTTLGIALYIANECAHFKFDHERKAITYKSKCSDSHNHTIFIDMSIDSTSNRIVTWKLQINTLSLFNNITFGLISE
eukprot:521611_1